jgi:hypothetical protein
MSVAFSTTILTPGIGSLFISKTLPLTSFCAVREKDTSRNNTKGLKKVLMVIVFN